MDFFKRGGSDDGCSAPSDAVQRYGTNGKQVTAFVIEGRRLLLDHLKVLHAKGGATSRHNVFPVTLPAMAQFRATRRIVGQTTLADDMEGRYAMDSIGMVADWRKPGSVWEIPYGTLVPTGIKGLLAAGRCISCEDEAWVVTRVIPPAAFTGQVAGLAAALAVQNQTTPDKLKVKTIQPALKKNGIPLHLSDVGL